MPAEPAHPYVSRGGMKLRHALDHFAFDPAGLRCADFGASTGGFTDCLLRAAAAAVVAVDTAYGALAWRLRTDPRVTPLERTNVLHTPPPADDGRVDLVVIDLGWTPQRLCVPVALRWLAPAGRIITLVKPHYELTPAESRLLLRAGVLDEPDALRVAQRTLDTLPALGAAVAGFVRSPITGGKSAARGNIEYLALLRAADDRPR